MAKKRLPMGCATSQTEDKPEFLDVGDVLVQFDPTAGGATPSTFQAIRVKVLRANKLIKADSKGSHQSLFVLPSLSLPPPTLPTLSLSTYTPPYTASVQHTTRPMCMKHNTPPIALSGLLRLCLTPPYDATAAPPHTTPLHPSLPRSPPPQSSASPTRTRWCAWARRATRSTKRARPGPTSRRRRRSTTTRTRSGTRSSRWHMTWYVRASVGMVWSRWARVGGRIVGLLQAP